MILKDYVTKALKSAITIFSKAHGMSYSHIRTFTITVTLTKTFASASSDNSLFLVTPACVTNDEIYAKSVTGRKKRKNKKGNCKAFCITRKCRKFTQKFTILCAKVPRKFLSWASRKTKMPNHTIFFRYQL